jgi:polyisoprenyl-phosphate glycosyltransferase
LNVHPGAHPTLSIVVPLFNEESNIKSLYAELRQAEQRLMPIRLEIVYVDDCSQDQTAALVRDLCSQHDNVKFIRFAKNSGSHAAILAGIAASSGDCVMFLAGDLQDPPKLIPQMLDEWRKGFGIVWGARTEESLQRKKDSLFSRLYWQAIYVITNGAMPKTGVDFFLIDRKVADVISPQCNRSVPFHLLVAETGFKTAVVRYEKRDRAGGKSGWTLKKKLMLVLETMLFSPHALRLLSVVGFALTAMGLLGLVLAGFSALFGAVAATALVVLLGLCFFSGLQMVTLGLVGEYLFLNLKETRNAPRFVIAERVNFSSRKDEPATVVTAISALTPRDLVRR